MITIIIIITTLGGCAYPWWMWAGTVSIDIVLYGCRHAFWLAIFERALTKRGLWQQVQKDSYIGGVVKEHIEDERRRNCAGAVSEGGDQSQEVSETDADA